MRTDNQLSFTAYETSLKLKPKIKIHVYQALCAPIIKCIGVTITK